MTGFAHLLVHRSCNDVIKARKRASLKLLARVQSRGVARRRRHLKCGANNAVRAARTLLMELRKAKKKKAGGPRNV